MKPCVECGKMIRKKDSIMTIQYVCSSLCKTNRKLKQPKKISQTSAEYWLKKGLSLQESQEKISQLQKSRSPRSVDYWIKKGYTMENAIKQVSIMQRANSQLRLEKYDTAERKRRSPFCKEYWMEQGISEEEAKSYIMQRSDNMSLQYFISKFGETAGTLKYNALCESRKINYTLDGYINNHGDEAGRKLWSKKFKNRHNSKKANNFFLELSNIFTGCKIYSACNENGEYGILDSNFNCYYFFDFVVPEYNLCVEFYGDYWHCNPKKYNSEYLHKQTNLTAQEIWDRDKNKQQCMLNTRGYHTIVVWESDNMLESIKMIKEYIKNVATKNQN